MTDKPQAAAERWLPISDTADMLNVGHAFLVKLIKGGTLPCRATNTGGIST